MKQIGTMADYTPKEYQKKDLKACDEATLHEILGWIIINRPQVERLLHEMMRMEARLYCAMYERGAFSYEKLALLDKDNKEVNNL